LRQQLWHPLLLPIHITSYYAVFSRKTVNRILENRQFRLAGDKGARCEVVL